MTKKPYPSDKADQYMLRFPEGMRETLKEEAADNGRSLNAEIIARLQKSIDLENANAQLNDLLNQAWADRAQLNDIINAQDRAFQSLRQSHSHLVTIAKHLGQMFLSNSDGQPDFLKSLAQMLADLTEVDEAEPSEKTKDPLWVHSPPDPQDQWGLSGGPSPNSDQPGLNPQKSQSPRPRRMIDLEDDDNEGGADGAK